MERMIADKVYGSIIKGILSSDFHTLEEKETFIINEEKRLEQEK